MAMGTYRQRLHEEHGFTLVELMVVILNLGILLAIAVPAFTGALVRVHDSAAKASLRTGLTAGRIFFVGELGDYSAAALNDLTQIESSVLWVPEGTTSDEPKIVSRDVTTGVLVLAAFSRAGTCFFVRDDPPNDLSYGRIDGAAPADCYAANSAGVTFEPSW